jgi:hypothetical protein
LPALDPAVRKVIDAAHVVGTASKRIRHVSDHVLLPGRALLESSQQRIRQRAERDAPYRSRRSKD